jgi:hypothetical protein
VAIPDRTRARLVLVSGTFGKGSSVIVNDNLATVANMGSLTTGAIERAGKANTVKSLGDLTMIAPDGSNLLLGRTASNITVSGSTITIDLANQPNSGTGNPRFIWKDNGSHSFTDDRAPTPNTGIGPVGNTVGTQNVVLVGDPTGSLTLQALPGNVVVDASNSVAYVGTAGVTTTYTWALQSGPGAITNTSFNGPVLTFHALVPGTYVFALTMVSKDAGGNPVVNPFTDALGQEVTFVTVVVADQLPVANAGPDRVIVGGAAQMDGSASYDPNVGPGAGGIAYVWSAVDASGTLLPSSVFTASDTIVNPTFTPGKAGTYTVTLTVYKLTNLAEFSSDSAVITLMDASALLPTADPGVGQVARLNQTVTLDGTSSRDPLGTTLSFAWRTVAGPAPVTLSDSTVAQPTFVPTAPGTYLFELTVTDTTTKTSSLPARVSVIVVDDASPTPRLAPAAEPRIAGLEQAVFLASQPDLTTNAPTVTLADGTVRKVLFVDLASAPPTSPDLTTGLSKVEVIVGSSLFATLYVDTQPGDADPAILNIQGTSGSTAVNVIRYGIAGQAFVLDGTRSLDDEFVKTFTWTQTDGPTGFGTQEGNLLSVVPQVGSYAFQLTVTDNIGLSSFPRTVRVDVVPPGLVGVGPPQAVVKGSGGGTTTLAPATSVQPLVVGTTQGSSVSLDASSSFSRNGGALSFKWVQVSGPIAILSGDTTPTLNATVGSSGVYEFALIATDANGASDVQTFYVVASSAGAKTPFAVIKDVSDQQLTNGTVEVSLDGSGSSVSGTPTYIWSQIRGVPVVVVATGADASKVTVTISEPGTYDFVLNVSDGTSLSGPAVVEFHVTGQGVSPLPGHSTTSKSSGGCAISAAPTGDASAWSPAALAFAALVLVRLALRRAAR